MDFPTNPLRLMGFHKDANFRKLITHDDPYNLHKSLGIFALFSFFYRYGYIYLTTGSLGFADSNKFAWLTMLLHTALAFSSIIFSVPAKRIDAKPMVIYEEYRQHAIVFTSRCFFVFATHTLLPNAPVYVVPLIVMAHHLFADDITRRHGSGSTAVRAVGQKANAVQTTVFYRHVSKLYSFYQFLAIASHIAVTGENLNDMAYNAIIAIQSSAFLMTMYRKRIVRGRTHMIVYSFCLILSAYHIVRVIGLKMAAGVLLTFLVRINLPRAYSNKYVLWTIFLVAPYLFDLLKTNLE
jgi:hypothetical protein